MLDLDLAADDLALPLLVLRLAVVGTVVVAVVTGVAAVLFLGLDPLTGLLLGSMLASTDSAAVFGLLRGSTLRRRLVHTMEAETAFNDPVKGEQLSTKMYDDGAEIIYHASGASGAGLFNAAVEAQKLAIGVDSDQYLTASPEQQPLILTSMLKRVDVAVYNAIEAVGSGTLGGSQVFGMAEDGVDYATSNPEQLTSDITEQLDKFKQQIIDGTIVVPDTPGG